MRPLRRTAADSVADGRRADPSSWSREPNGDAAPNGTARSERRSALPAMDQRVPFYWKRQTTNRIDIIANAFPVLQRVRVLCAIFVCVIEGAIEHRNHIVQNPHTRRVWKMGVGALRCVSATLRPKNTRFNPFIDASSSAILAISSALPLRMANIWKPIGTMNTPSAVTPNIIIGSIWLRCRWRAVDDDDRLATLLSESSRSNWSTCVDRTLANRCTTCPAQDWRALLALCRDFGFRLGYTLQWACAALDGLRSPHWMVRCQRVVTHQANAVRNRYHIVVRHIVEDIQAGVSQTLPQRCRILCVENGGLGLVIGDKMYILHSGYTTATIRAPHH